MDGSHEAPDYMVGDRHAFWKLPCVNTCMSILKLPRYSSKAALEAAFLAAVHEEAITRD